MRSAAPSFAGESPQTGCVHAESGRKSLSKVSTLPIPPTAGSNSRSSRPNRLSLRRSTPPERAEMPIAFEVATLMLLAYLVGLALGWALLARSSDHSGD